MTLTAHLSYFLVLLLAGQGLSDSLLTKVNVSNLLSIPTPPLGSFLYELAYFSSSFLIFLRQGPEGLGSRRICEFETSLVYVVRTGL
jgi:hypothetical protein